jgi:hypothetical protein
MNTKLEDVVQIVFSYLRPVSYGTEAARRSKGDEGAGRSAIGK